MTAIVRCLQHVSVPRPAGAEAEEHAIAFYSDVLGLEHIPNRLRMYVRDPFGNQIELTEIQGDYPG